MIWLKLTRVQVEKLAEEEALARKALKDGRPGSILGQIYPNESTFRACFVPEEVAIEIINILKRYGVYGENR